MGCIFAAAAAAGSQVSGSGQGAGAAACWRDAGGHVELVCPDVCTPLWRCDGPPRRASRRAWVWGLIAAALLASAAIAARRAWPPLPVVLHPQLATVRQGEFRDELVLRAQAEPLRLVQIDAQESGRVEAVLVQDGALVEAGQPLYRLYSREQEAS